MTDGADAVEARVESVARASYGRLVAVLAASTRDIQLAEDALADAFERALRTWPSTGIPGSPEGWLITVARNRQRDVWKSSAHRTATPFTELTPAEEAMDTIDPDAIPDKRLELLFVCAHPAIDVVVRTPLMLQAVLGFDAASIARVFAVPEATMAQRLVRAKRRIRDARIRFAVPDRSELQERLPAVFEAVYGAFALDWRGTSADTLRQSMAAEALHLSVTLASLLEDDPEAFGLAALLCFSLARSGARLAPDGRLVPLDRQDPALWDAHLIAEGEAYLGRAHALGRVGRFQLEAAIQSAHCDRRRSGATDWRAILRLSEALVALSPTLGARVALVSTRAEVDGPLAALEQLDAIVDPSVATFQPAWATRAYLLDRLHRSDEAVTAFLRAAELSADPASRAYLEQRAEALGAA